MKVDFTEFDLAELRVLDTRDAIGLPEMGASVIIKEEYVSEMDDVLGDSEQIPSDVSSSCCCCC